VQSRLQGIVKGTQAGAVQMTYIMSDNQIKPGEQIVTSGGDRIFPKGLPLGTVKEVAPGKDMFLNIRVTPAADLNRVEEVLVITKVVEKAPDGTEISGPIRASDILAQRLPSVPQKSAEDGTNGSPAASPATTNPGTSVVPPKTANSNSTTKPSTGAPAPAPATTKPATGVVPPKTTTPKENKPASAAPQGN
jgi:rod shape-determining protein MreC